jgi:demethylmenaquinone methyltransferase/2-methoxy-6-polyprenyl-1,4-benzoquinol methylase
MELNPRIYNRLIDPLLASVRSRLIFHAGEGQKVLDVASGTGELVRGLHKKSSYVAGVDIEGEMIEYSRMKAADSEKESMEFFRADARELSIFSDNSFNIATMSLALHQFNTQDRPIILSEIFRIADELVIADYSYPLPEGLKKVAVKIAERIAGKEHYQNFKTFMKEGGTKEITEKHGYTCIHTEASGSGIFSIYKIQKK